MFRLSSTMCHFVAFGSTSDQALKMSESILLGARGSRGRLNHLAADDIEIDEPRQGAMPDVLELTAEHMTCLHRQIRMLALQRLHARQLIQTDGAFSLPGALLRTG